MTRPEVEVLGAEPRPPLPRWVRLLAWAVAAGAVVAVVANTVWRAAPTAALRVESVHAVPGADEVRLQLQVHNAGAQPVPLTSVALSATGLSAHRAADGARAIAAGGTATVVLSAEVACPAAAQAGDAVLTVAGTGVQLARVPAWQRELRRICTDGPPPSVALATGGGAPSGVGDAVLQPVRLRNGADRPVELREVWSSTPGVAALVAPWPPVAVAPGVTRTLHVYWSISDCAQARLGDQPVLRARVAFTGAAPYRVVALAEAALRAPLAALVRAQCPGVS